MTRLVVWLAVLVLSAGPAWADPVEQTGQTAMKAADAIILSGPIGSLFILVVIGLVLALVASGLVIRALWNTIKDRDAATVVMRKEYDTAINSLQDKRAAELVENTKQVAQTAISGSAAITASNERLADASSRIQTLAERILPVPEAVADIKLRIGEIARACGRGPA